MKLQNTIASAGVVALLVLSMISANTAFAASWSSPMTSGTTLTLRCMWGDAATGNDNVFAVGHTTDYSSGIILKYDGGRTWSRMDSATAKPKLSGIWGTSYDNVYAAGRYGTVLHYDGNIAGTWSPVDTESITTLELRSIWGSSEDDIFVVGYEGVIIHYNGSTWSTMNSGTTRDLLGVWGSSGSDVYAVGGGYNGDNNPDNGIILHYDGISWTPMNMGSVIKSLRGVWGSSGTDVFAVGWGGVILHYDGNVDHMWELMDTISSNYLNSVWGTSGSDVFASGGGGGIIAHYDGNAAGNWELMQDGTSVYLNSLWGTSPTDVFCVGQGGTVIHYGEEFICDDGIDNDVDGSSDCDDADCNDDPACQIETICNDGIDNDGNSFIDCEDENCDGRVCEDGDVCTIADTCLGGICVSGPPLSCNDNNVCTDDSCNPASGCEYTDNTASCDDGLYCTGTDTCSGGICAHSGDPCLPSLFCDEALDQCTEAPPVISASWSPMTSPTTDFILRSTWGSSNTDVFIVGHNEAGSQGIILRYDGDGDNDGNTDAIWETMVTGTINKLNCIWGTAANNILAVGTGGTILRYDGSSWSPMTSGVTTELRGVWANAANDAFAVGLNGTILHYDGSSWSPMTSGTTEALYGVWGSSGTDVYAVSQTSDWILHYDGISWSQAYYNASATTPGLHFIWGSSATDIFAVGNGGTILHYDGISWSVMASGTTQHLVGVWGTSASDVFACGYGGTIRHYNGTSWSTMSSGTTAVLWGLWGTSGTDVFLAGRYGTILHYGEDICDDGSDNDLDGYADCDDFDCENKLACRVTVYEDAEDELTNRWIVYDDIPANAQIMPVYDVDRQSNVIEFVGAGTLNGYRLRKADGSPWHNTRQTVLEWSMKYDEYFVVYIDVETNAGHRYLTYRPLNYDPLSLGGYVEHGLGTSARDGQWHTFVRDLQADLEDVEPGVIIEEVNGFLIRGSGMVDDIRLLSEFDLPAESLCFDGIDNDGDGLTDCVDLDCDGAVGGETMCGVGVCAGNVGQRSCQDGSEIDTCDPLAGAGLEMCADSVDNDCDGLADCYDPDCAMVCEEIVYENAEDGLISRWTIYDKDPDGALIENVADEVRGSNVIKFTGAGTGNGYRLRMADGNLWHNTSQVVLEWSMKYEESFVVYIDLMTTDGHHKYLTYRPLNYSTLGDGEYVLYGLGADAIDGTWHTFVRDLQADLWAAQSNANILEVNGFLIRGSGMVDDVRMLNAVSLPIETLCFDGIDNDGDGLTDCVDFDCEGADGGQTSCGVGVCSGNSGSLLCQGGSAIDTCDPLAGAEPEVCTDSLDNDCDGLADCSDPECAMVCGEIVYEDAEDGLTIGWSIYDSDPSDAQVTNVYDDQRDSLVIRFIGAGTSNGYRLRNTDGSPWHNTTQVIIEWSMKYAESFVVYIDLVTTEGHRYLTYRPRDYNQLGSGEYVEYGLGTDAMDGTWHTFRRNLQTDLDAVPDNGTILELNGFLIRGSGMIDDIKMLNSMP